MLKTQPKQLVDSHPLDIALPGLLNWESSMGKIGEW